MPLASFHPTVRKWFAERLGEPTPPQREGWPRIREGQNTLIAAPDRVRQDARRVPFGASTLSCRAGPDLPDETHVLYVSPLKALASDIQKNLDRPLAEIRALDPVAPRSPRGRAHGRHARRRRAPRC